MSADFYDYDGNPISIEEWSLLLEARHQTINSIDPNLTRWRVGLDQIGDTRISTVWIGLNHRWDGGQPPLIFETLVERDGDEIDMQRYSTHQQALAGHQRHVTEQQATLNLIQSALPDEPD